MDIVFLSTWLLFVYPQYQHYCSGEVLGFFVELADSASPRSSLQAPEGRQFQSSSFVFSLKRESEQGVQKRESEMNPRTIFSLGLQPKQSYAKK